MIKGEDETLDTFYHGRVLILQREKGYRFSVDAPLLADFIQSKEKEELLELGTGNGVISLLLSIKPFKHITAVEIQGSLAELAERNVSLNHIENKITIVHKDLRSFRPKRKYDVIFSNPPYIKTSRGRLSVDQEKTIAKHELKCDIFDIMRKTKELLKEEGRAYFIFPAKRKEDFDEAVSRHGLKMKAVRYVMPRPEKPPRFFLVECDLLSKKEILHPPLILNDEKGNDTAEARAIFSGRSHAAAD